MATIKGVKSRVSWDFLVLFFPVLFVLFLSNQSPCQLLLKASATRSGGGYNVRSANYPILSCLANFKYSASDIFLATFDTFCFSHSHNLFPFEAGSI